MIITIEEILLVGIIFLPIWYLYNSFEYFLNSGNLGRHRYFFPFQCFWEDVKLYSSFGRKERLQFVKNQFPLDSSAHTVILGEPSWELKDVIGYDGNYDDGKLLACFRSIMGYGIYFLLKNFILLCIVLAIVL